MSSAITPLANKPAKDLILVYTVQLKPMIKAHFSGRNDFCHETEARKVMVDFKFDALYR